MDKINFDTLREEYKESFKDAFAKTDIAILEAKVKLFNKTEIDIKSPLDQLFRDVLLEFLEKEAPVANLQRLVTFCVDTCRRGLTTPTMPVVLLGDIFESLTLESCEVMFEYVENEVNVWKEELFFMSCKNNLLRMCNDLLRRLSRSSATVFCGRILLFLAKFFPFSERSGLNIVSEFNLENVTEYGTEASEDSNTEVDVAGEKKNIVIDYSLYCKFWSLQDFFRNPNQCYNKVQWKLFCSHATSILSTFQGLKLEYVAKDPTWAFKDSTPKPYFPKYLTNQKLLDLQIYDVNFRRFILLQFLILFQYLTSTVKFKSDSFELKQDQKEWVQATTDKIYALLKETPPDGEHFAQICRNILKREEYWSTWKNDGCPEFKKSLSNELPLEKKNQETTLLGDMIKESTESGRYYMGNSELTKLWNLYPDNLEACKAKDRDFLPSLETYFAEAIEQVESAATVGDDENLLKDTNFGWRALRLMARRSPHFFSYSNSPFAHLSDYLQMMIKKIAADRPGTTQEIGQIQNDCDLEANLFKPGEDENMKNADTDDMDDNFLRFKVTIFTTNQFEQFCEKIAPNWRKLASKLGFKPDEIEYFGGMDGDEHNKARSMLHVWFEDDDDSTLENFCYYLEGLEMMDAVEVVKQAIQQNESLMS